jgi:hypothetical protein
VACSYAKAKIKIKVLDERNREHEFLYTLKKKEENRLGARTKKVIKTYKKKVLKELAEKNGYAEEIYGKDNYKLVKINEFQYAIFDVRFKKILYSNVKIDSMDDF